MRTTFRLMTLFVAGAGLVTSTPASGQDSRGATAEAMVELLEQYRFDQLTHPQIQSDSIKPVLASTERPHKLLILPVRFADTGYDRFTGDPMQDEKNRAYFQNLLFAGSPARPEPGTLSHYYWHQSRGRYNVTGDILPVVGLTQPLHYYGRPIQSSDGTWRNDERATELVVDSLQAAYRASPNFSWLDYDQWDPEDFDADGNRDEPDGYLDHFILIVAGKGQSSCHGLFKLGEKLNPNAAANAISGLNADELGCVDRIWPHRFALSQNLDRGPLVSNRLNASGGIDIGNGLWVRDYNMQSEYTDPSTFIHEFGHSLGLPDIYARATNNSTAAWEAMSSTTSPQPQELSAWSRTVLGWLEPCVVRPSAFGGASTGSLYLKTMNEWTSTANYAPPPGLCDAVMVILPPKFRDIEMGPLDSTHGRQAVYTGQGNSMNRSLSRTFDLSGVSTDEPVVMTLDTWFVIEAEWDYLYVEVGGEDEPFRRILPMDKEGADDSMSVMPSAKGHEGAGSQPGFTGRSGDLDGDGKVESAAGCEPEAERTLAEDRVGTTERDPCEASQWVEASFDLSEYRGREVTVRFTYFTDMAAVEDGALLDNVAIPAIDFHDDFERAALTDWEADGFTLSGGRHRLAVPHFYLLEYRDPSRVFDTVENYDQALREPSCLFFPDQDGGMSALNVNYRSGVVMWYYNGEYLWSQNEPAETGAGRGFLLVVDSTPQEFAISALPERYFHETDDWTYWQFDETAQPVLRSGYVDTMCFQRQPSYYSGDVAEEDITRCEDIRIDGAPPMEQLRWDERPLMYSYTIINEYLPGPERRARLGGGSLFDLRIRDGRTEYRLYDRVLRRLHSADAAFAVDDFVAGLEVYRARDGVLTPVSTQRFPAVREFTDVRPNRYQSPRLPFGGADIPSVGFGYVLESPDSDAPEGSVVRVDYHWQ
ncbi:MAG: immune inhibitor A domain-containing protein [Acidobacteriota bacterium]|nr:immune inhibitor A domain-containing protein [Acidobacteriota bacterium]